MFHVSNTYTDFYNLIEIVDGRSNTRRPGLVEYENIA